MFILVPLLNNSDTLFPILSFSFIFLNVGCLCTSVYMHILTCMAAQAYTLGIYTQIKHVCSTTCYLFLVAHVCVCLIAFSSLLKLSSYWFLMPIFSSGKSFIKYLILWDISVSFLGILLLIICQLMRYFKSLSKSSNFQDISKFFYCKCALLNIATFS